MLALLPSVSDAILVSHRFFTRWFSVIFLHFFFSVCFSAILTFSSTSNGRVLLIYSFVWIIFFPLHVFYIFYGYQAVPAAVIFGSHIVHLRQMALLNAFKQLIIRLKTKKKSEKYLTNNFDHSHFLPRYLLFNRRLAKLASDIKQYSEYWSIPLSGYFSGFLAMQCYLAYIVFFIPLSNTFSQLFFVYSLLTLETLQWALIFQCAKVAKTNNRLEKINYCFYLTSFFSTIQIKMLK